MEGTPGHPNKPSSLPEFSRLVNLASENLGAEIVCCSDDFFASVDNLIKDSEAVWDSELMTDKGKWMDGWETKRHNKQEYDWAIVKLGLKGFVEGVLVDTSHFSGNHAPSISIEAVSMPYDVTLPELTSSSCPWTEVVSKNSCYGCYWNFFKASNNTKQSFSHIRIKVYPDGGVARLRVYGRVVPSFLKYLKENEVLDLALITNGGLVVSASDSHFSSKDNIIKPWRSKSMKDGWETKRSRTRDHNEWIIFQLGHAGFLKYIEIDTRHFKGNYPDFCEVYGCNMQQTKEESGEGHHLVQVSPTHESWTRIVDRTELGPHRVHFLKNLQNNGPFTHLKVVIYPDGGISRFRAYGTLKNPNITTPNSSASLMCEAASVGDLDTIKLLLKEGISINVGNYDQRTALHLAAAEGKTEVVKFLLEKGADSSAKDRWGNTPRDEAIRSNHEDIGKLLQ